MHIFPGVVGLIIACSTTPVCSAQPTTVFLGGVSQNFCAGMVSGAALRQTMATDKIGLYEHANGMAACSPAQRQAIWSFWGRTGVTPQGQGRALAEVGAVPEPDAGKQAFRQYLSYFGGAYPGEANMNILTGVGDGTGTYTAAAADRHPSIVYSGYVTSADLEQMKSAIRVANAHGARNVAIFSTQNAQISSAAVRGDDFDDPVATGAYFSNVRAAALYAGGVALDVPPSYYAARPLPYRHYVAQLVHWGLTQHIRVSLVVSPHASGCGFDKALLENTKKLVADLRSARAMPTQWVVERYDTKSCGNDIADDSEPESLNATALYLASLPDTAPPGSRAAGSNGITDASLQ